ncbi:MAG: hypothetical protein R2697_19600 [Ilumatobacteraceae bacterium]
MTDTCPHRIHVRFEPGRPVVPAVPDGHRWDRAGDAWGRRALDWACLFEHYAIDVIVAMFDRLELQPGSELLDVACGSGLAMRMADGLGASVAGIDAAESLIEIARSGPPRATSASATCSTCRGTTPRSTPSPR